MIEMKELVDTLNQYRNSYYNDNTSIVSDKEYDALFDKLVDMEQKTGVVYANSPTVTVGYEVVGKLKKVKHNHPLLSLGKTTDMKEFADYFGSNDVCVMAKLDGLTASIKYCDGKLLLAESRGNGEIGEDITHNVKTFVNIPMEIPFHGELIIDGECIIDYETFDRINHTEQTQYKNPRNLVSGTVRQLDSKIAANRCVKFVAWKLYSAKDVNGNILDETKTYQDGFRFLSSLGFDVVPQRYINIDHEYMAFWESVISDLRSQCDDLKYPIDGIVGSFNDIVYGNTLGYTSHHPKHSLAYKFYQDINETTLIDIEWSTSRTGLVNPVAIVEPVEIDGTTVSRATLNNVSIIKELELGIGDTLAIIKANQIIPQIKENLTRSNTYELPTRCPSCGHPLALKSDGGREMLYCTNKMCPAINHDKISNFASREAMNIVGISEERLKVFMDLGYITDFASLYHLKNYRNELVKLDGFGDVSIDNLLAAIEESKRCRFSNLLVAIGIPGIGKSTAKTLSKFIAHKDTYKDSKEGIFQKFIDMASNHYDWSFLDGFGSIISNDINRYVMDNREQIAALVPILEIVEDEEETGEHDLFGGQSFCVTGKLVYYENRDKIVEDIERFGGKIVSSVTSKTNYLITNDTNSGSSKNEKAKKFGTTIITEQEFLNLIKEISK